MIIAAAQTVPKKSIADNINDHCRLTIAAAKQGVGLIVFPELSLTGYQRENAAELSFDQNDPRLDSLREIAHSHKIIIVAGAPVQINPDLHIGSFIIFTDRTLLLYTKQFLHEGEEEFFKPDFNYNPQINLGDEIISFAICADTANPEHPANASRTKSTMYLASVFNTPKGITKANQQLSGYAKKYQMKVLMSNFGGPSWGLESGGKSAYWNNKGELVASLNHSGEELLIIGKEDEL